MPKYNTPQSRKAGLSSPVLTDQVPTGRTHQGGPGYARDATSELFLLAVSSMGMDLRFYDRRPQDMAFQVTRARDAEFALAHPRHARIPFQFTPAEIRLIELAREVAVADWGFMEGFVPWLRTEANMRSASIVVAAEAIRARHGAGITPAGRKMAAGALRRADEPGELAAYWMGKYGLRHMPLALKNAIRDGATARYNQYSLLKYDTASHGMRMGDVIELFHPRPAHPVQSLLFRYAIERRHGRDNEIPEELDMIRAHEQVMREGTADASMIPLDPAALDAAGMTWEDLLSMAGSRVDKAALWSAIIPSMGVMALLRNLRNFDEAGVPDEIAGIVIHRLTSPEVIANSMLFPFRFLAAYNAISNDRWRHPLGKGLDLSLSNVPVLDGNTLILVDRSDSMYDAVSKHSGLNRADTAALFGCALARRAARATVVQYGSASHEVRLAKGGSLLNDLKHFQNLGGTWTAAAIQANLRPEHTRVILLTDEQHAAGDPSGAVPAGIPMYTWNLVGYERGHAPSGWHNRHTFGGLADTAFRMISMLEAGQNAEWPWLVKEDALA
jgi:hypothetical protein